MKFCVHKFGRPSADQFAQLVTTYQTRLKTMLPVDSNIIRVNEQNVQSNYTDFLKKLTDTSSKTQRQQILVCLDERGKLATSVELAEKVRTWNDDTRIGMVHFAVGGSHGFSDEFKQAATWKFSLSPLTLQGDLAWLLLWEQLYRAVTIIKGHPYHH